MSTHDNQDQRDGDKQERPVPTTNLLLLHPGLTLDFGGTLGGQRPTQGQPTGHDLPSGSYWPRKPPQCPSLF